MCLFLYSYETFLFIKLLKYMQFFEVKVLLFRNKTTTKKKNVIMNYVIILSVPSLCDNRGMCLGTSHIQEMGMYHHGVNYIQQSDNIKSADL